MQEAPNRSTGRELGGAAGELEEAPNRTDRRDGLEGAPNGLDAVTGELPNKLEPVSGVDVGEAKREKREADLIGGPADGVLVVCGA